MKDMFKIKIVEEPDEEEQLEETVKIKPLTFDGLGEKKPEVVKNVKKVKEKDKKKIGVIAKIGLEQGIITEEDL